MSAAMEGCRRLGMLLPLALMLLALPSVVGCSRVGGEEGQAGEGSGDEAARGQAGAEAREEEDALEDAPPVEVVALERGPIEAVLRLSTNLEAEREVQVFSEAARQVERLLVEEGNEVRKGQVLVELQDDEQRTALARVESQLKKARREYERQQSLYTQNLISEQTFNEATYEIEQLELALEDAQRELGYATVRAPISGTVTSRLVNVGDHVTVNQHLFDIVDFDSIVARVYVPEKEVARISPGQQARIYAEAFGAAERHGVVDRIAPVVDPRTGTVKVTVAIPRSEELLPGMFVTVELVTELHPDALLAPKRALIYDAGQVFVYRLREDSTVERLLLEVELEDQESIEPAGDVLEPGDRVVVAGQAALKDGIRVRVLGQGDGEAE